MKKFAAYFNLTLPGEAAGVRELDAHRRPNEIRVDSKDFRVWVGGALIGTNTNPDPDAFGVIRPYAATPARLR